MRRLIVVATGLLLAFLAGCCVLATALLVESLTVPAQTSLALFNVAALLLASLQSGETGHLLAIGLTAIWAALLALCLVPVGLVALLGEAMRARSLVFCTGGSGVATAAVPTVLRTVRNIPARADAGPGEQRATLILFLTGVATGLVYWAVAGRSAAPARE